VQEILTKIRAANRATLKLSASLCLLLPGVLLLHVLPFEPAVSYAAVFVATSIIFLWMARLLFVSEPTPRFLVVAIAAALLVQLSFLNTNPIGSDDVYRYMWDGKVQASGIDPYRYAPNASELNALHSSLVPSTVNHPDMKTVYFPLGQWVFYGCYRLSNETLWGYKLILLIAQIAAIAGLLLMLKQQGISSKFILLYALCPLPILQFGLDAHVDAVGLPLLIFGLVLYLDGKKMLSYLLFALSISIKPVALLALPILFLRERGGWNKAQVVLVPSVILGGQFLPYVFTSNPFEALFTFARHWTFNGIVFETLNLYFADNQTTRLICATLLTLLLIILYLRRNNLLDTLYYSVLLLLLFSPVVHPWYVTWLTVLLPFARRWSGVVYSASVSLTAYTVVHYKLYGVWEQSAALLALECIPVVILMIMELRKGRSPDARSAQEA
jgi:hypothetical protein